MKTNLICDECGRNINSDEGFIPYYYKGKMYCKHSPTCENPIRPEKTRRYHPEKSKFVLQYMARFL